MGDKTGIEWTDATWNPVRGCAIVSKGCTNCYAMRQAHRSNHSGGAYAGLTTLTRGGPVWTGNVRLVPELLDQPLRWARPRRIFVNSMSDLFHEDVPDEFINKVFAVMACATRHTYQILTKRPQRMLDWWRRRPKDHFGDPEDINPLEVWPKWTPVRGRHGGYDNCGNIFPLSNVWLGVSVEDQAAADERIPLLLAMPAAVRWISAEPLLGPVSIFCKSTGDLLYSSGDDRNPGSIDWVVAGGESGPGARPVHPDWLRDLRDQCAAAHDGVPFFFKQWGAWAPINYVDANTGHRLVKLSFTDRERVIGGTAEGTAPCNVQRVGKKAAGRDLDGRTHDAYPA